MEQMTTLRELVDQAIEKKEEEKQIAEEQAAKERYWKIPICDDDDEDNTIAITPIVFNSDADNSSSDDDSPYGFPARHGLEDSPVACSIPNFTSSASFWESHIPNLIDSRFILFGTLNKRP
ncbi:hypothetical protein Tco_0086207 [Tanacetum coccineum]